MNGMSETRKAIMARLGFAAGEKAEMQKEYVLWGLPKGKTDAIHEQILSTKAKTPAEMDAIKRRAAADGWHSFRVQILDLSKPYKGFGFSRPGSKAEFGITKEQIRGASREELRSIEQRLMALAKSGDKNAAALLDYVEEEYNDRYRSTHSRPGAKSAFGNGAINRAFLSKIDSATRNKILTSIAKHYGISASEAMAEVTDADAESLLDYMTEPERSATSVLLKRHGFSRPGAKEAMAKTFSGKTFKLNSGTVVAAWDDGSPAQFMNVAQAKAFAEKHGLGDVIKGRGTGFFILPEKDTSSRPGAKSTYAADGFYGDSEAEAVRHMSAEATAEDIKYGDKIKMATDPAVGKKISKLMDEGYPQNQAIAIALDMKRKGEI